MYSYFLRWCIHCQTAIVHDVPNWKKERCNWLISPHFVFKCAPPVWIQSKFHECYAMGATLSCGMTLAKFFYHGGTSRYPQITGLPASQKNDNNHEHRRNSDEFILSSSLAPMLTTSSSSPNTPTPSKCGTVTSTRHTVGFSRKIVATEIIWIQVIRAGQLLVGHHSCHLQRTFLTSMPLKQWGRAEEKWCENMVSMCNDCWLLRHECLLVDNQPVSPSCSFLFTSIHNNQHLDIWKK